jgi:hypothetical protein
MALAAARKQPSPPDLVEQIRRELDVAALRVQQAERARAQYAEASVTNPKVVADYQRADESVKLAQGEVRRLELALRSAEEQARAAADRVAKERTAKQIERIEALAAERDATGAELAVAVKILDETFRKLLALGREITAAWPLGTHDGSSCILTPGSITRALQHEIFRVGSRPRMLGGQDEPDALTHLPGGMSPTLEFINAPNKVVPLVDVLTQASRHLSEILRTGKSAPNGTHTQIEQRPRTDAEIRLAGLLQRQAELSALTSATPDQDREYAEIVAEIAGAQT